VAGTAADARQTADAARNAARSRVLAAGAAADTGDAALATGTAARTAELAAGAAVSVGVAAAAAWVILEDNVRGRACRGWSGDRDVCCGSWGGSDRSGNSPGNN
jgi:hypothetical protein